MPLIFEGVKRRHRAMASVASGDDGAITGQVLRVRSLSSRLAFADVRLVEAEGAEVVELVVKERGLESRRGSRAAAVKTAGTTSGSDGSVDTGSVDTVDGRSSIGVPHVPTALKRFNVGDVVRFHGQWEVATAANEVREGVGSNC